MDSHKNPWYLKNYLIVLCLTSLECLSVDGIFFGANVDFDLSEIKKYRVEEANEFPFLVRIYDKRKPDLVCGGSVISSNEVLTASHCLVENGNVLDTSSFLVVAGCVEPFHLNYNYFSPILRAITNKTRACQIAEVDSLKLHSEFVLDTRFLSPNDIAVLKIVSQFNMTDGTVKSISLADPGQCKGGAVLVGWGCTNTEENCSNNNLYQVDVPLISNSECETQGRQITEKQLCTTAIQNRGCFGDSGSPLICLTSNNDFVAFGILSYGNQNCDGSQPDLYTKISCFLPWIWNQNSPEFTKYSQCNETIQSQNPVAFEPIVFLIFFVSIVLFLLVCGRMYWNRHAFKETLTTWLIIEKCVCVFVIFSTFFLCVRIIIEFS